MKKILAIILALVLALGLTATVWAEGDGTASGSMTGADFLAKAKDGVITLTGDVTLTSTWYISDGKTYTLNLNEHTLSGGSPVIQLMHGKLIINGVGTVKESTPYFGAVLIKGSKNESDENYSVLEVNSNVTLEGWSAIFVDQNAAKAYGVSVTVNGAVLNGAKDTDGSVGNGLYVNGSITHTKNAPEISLKNTTITATGEGMYLAGYAKTTLTDCDISGVTGIEIRAGELTVNGGSITGTATPIGVAPNGNGSTVTGAGIAVSQHTTMLPLTVTVNGSNVKGYSAFYQVDTLAEMGDNAGNKKFTEEQVAAAVAKITLSVNEGVYTATGEDGQAVYSENKTGFVSAGIFSSEVTSYLTNDAVAATVVNGNSTDYAVGSTAISAAITSNSTVTVTNGSIDLTDVPAGVTVKNTGEGKVTVNGTKEVKKGDAPYTVPAKTGGYYYYPSTSDTTTSTTTKGSPKTFDAGVGIYAVTAVLSVTGMAWTAKKRH